MGKKIKVLAYCDSPTCATGFGTVSRNIFEALYKTGRYDIDILGINYWGDPHVFPYRVWPTGTNPEKDPYGKKKCVNIMAHRDDFDILFLLQDTFIMDFIPELVGHLKSKGRPYRSICYFPVDGTPKEQWIKNVSPVDRLVAYSEFGKTEAKKAFPSVGNVEVIPHGVNINEFFVLDEEKTKSFRSQYFGKHADKFIITNVNRNQQRKDIPRTIQAFSEFRKHVPESVLYLHMAKVDQGWNLPEVCKAYGFNIMDDVIFPENFGPNQGYPRDVVNMLYNASDCVVSTCLGEGFGLSFIESMATKTPVIMPANTAMVENITEARGYLAKSGTSSSLFTILPHDNEVIRPLVDVDDLVDKLLQVYNNREEATRRAENAHTWIRKEMDWQGAIGKRWVNLFDEEVNKLNGVSTFDLEKPVADKTIITESF